MPFKDALIDQVTIGKYTETISAGDPTISWTTLYEADAYIETLKGIERFFNSDTNKAFVTHRIHLPLTDLTGSNMTLDETLEAVPVVPYDDATQRSLVHHYRFVVVDKVHGHHYEIDCERVSRG